MSFLVVLCQSYLNSWPFGVGFLGSLSTSASYPWVFRWRAIAAVAIGQVTLSWCFGLVWIWSRTLRCGG